MSAPKPVIEAVKRVEGGYSSHLPGKVVVSGVNSHRGRILDWRDPRTLTKPGEQVYGTFDVPEIDWGLPPIRKRDPLERVKSLTNRLVDYYRSTRRLPDDVVRLIQRDYWKAGMPITAEQLRQTAQRVLEVEARRQGRHLIPDVATGAVSAPRPHARTYDHSAYEA